jgi:hypothetical protein
MKRAVKDKSKKTGFTSLGVRVETWSAFKTFSTDRNRDMADVADAAFKAFERLPREEQDALIEGRPLEPAR